MPVWKYTDNYYRLGSGRSRVFYGGTGGHEWTFHLRAVQSDFCSKMPVKLDVAERDLPNLTESVAEDLQDIKSKAQGDVLTNQNSVLLAIAACLFSCTAFAVDTAPQVIDGATYTQPQQMVEVEPGRRLNLHCAGTGSPTVVFESGLGVPISNWGFVQPVIAQKTRACAYDRAGLGFSDAANRASDSKNIVDDLHRLLVAAAIQPPYVLVGHSYGGMTVRLYADTYPSEVVGMVLVDATVEDQIAAYRALDPQKRSAAQYFVDTIEPNLRDGRECVAAAPSGFVPGSELFKKCISDPFPQYSEAVNTSNQQQEMRQAVQQAGLSENEQVFRASADQVRVSRHSYGKLPLIVLTSGPRPPPKDPLTPEALALSAARRQLWVTLHDDLAKLSTRGVNEVVAGAKHYIQLDKPQAVIDAVARVLTMSKESRMKK
jgi:pimeloyl-ACP methyl ester carboxylesterase